MSRGVNRVILIGNCGQDPDVKYMASGEPITNVSVATSESWNDKKQGIRKLVLSGIALYFSINWQRSPGIICVRVHRSI